MPSVASTSAAIAASACQPVTGRCSQAVAQRHGGDLGAASMNRLLHLAVKEPPADRQQQRHHQREENPAVEDVIEPGGKFDALDFARCRSCPRRAPRWPGPAAPPPAAMNPARRHQERKQTCATSVPSAIIAIRNFTPEQASATSNSPAGVSMNTPSICAGIPLAWVSAMVMSGGDHLQAGHQFVANRHEEQAHRPLGTCSAQAHPRAKHQSTTLLAAFATAPRCVAVCKPGNIAQQPQQTTRRPAAPAPATRRAGSASPVPRRTLPHQPAEDRRAPAGRGCRSNCPTTAAPSRPSLARKQDQKRDPRQRQLRQRHAPMRRRSGRSAGRGAG